MNERKRGYDDSLGECVEESISTSRRDRDMKRENGPFFPDGESGGMFGGTKSDNSDEDNGKGMR